MTITPTIQVTVADFVKTHDGLVRLLKAIERSSGIGERVTTRRICDTVFNSRSEGLKIIRQAERAGYIYRIKMKKTRSKRKGSNKRVHSRRGRYYIINVLSPSGRDLLAKLKDV